ncbi:MAG: indole-3-glycerol phosphate synthase TrpC, partial [Polyangiaceae bacterium]
AKSRGLEPLVEIANEEELARALDTPARVIGVNARDLDTLAIDSKRAAALVADLPPDRVAIHLSGVRSEADLTLVARGRADGALIGEVLMREEDPSALLARFADAAWS